MSTTTAHARTQQSIDEENKLKSKVTKGVWSMAKDKANIQVLLFSVSGPVNTVGTYLSYKVPW